MVMIMDVDNERLLSLDEFADHVEQNVDVLDFDSVVENSWALRSLANDRDFVLDRIHAKLIGYWDMRNEPLSVPRSRSLPQTINLTTRPSFYVRANVWLPLESGESSADEMALYSYDIAHDHNYHLATVGYFGPGYVTETFRYDYRSVDGYWGEEIDLVPTGEHQLLPGRVTVYEAGVDVHIQRPPTEISVSLNLMCTPHDHVLRQQQYIFDARQRKIIGGSGDRTSERLFLLEIMKHVHDDDTVQLLEDFVTSYDCVRTKAQALRVAEFIRPGEIERLRSRASPEACRLSELPLVHGSDAGYSG